MFWNVRWRSPAMEPQRESTGHGYMPWVQASLLPLLKVYTIHYTIRSVIDLLNSINEAQFFYCLDQSAKATNWRSQMGDSGSDSTG